ncbi:MAG: chromosomal replication initiator protein DnaA [Rhodobacteraceae bacterium]|nr:chromosomal replication initiator protein DnaA [Paracoccaceae bacterium]
MSNNIWESVCEGLLKTVSKNEFNNWIQPLDFQGIEDGVANFVAPTNFIGTWVLRNYGEMIQRHFISEGTIIDRVAFHVDNSISRGVQKSSTRSKHEIQKSVSKVSDKSLSETQSVLPVAPLDKRFTFDSFVIGKPNELAHAASRRVAEGGPVTFNPLFLYGGVGLGKTHLMHAIAWETQRRKPGSKVIYLSAEQFMYRFVQALRFKDMLSFKELFRSVDLLMVDDVQFIAGKDSTQDEFFHTFNALVDQNKQIIISADRAPGEIDGLEDRIKSRLQSGLVVDLHPTDYELRLGILQSKAEKHAGHYPEVNMTDGVLEFLAHRISTNVRVLEGALTRLFAFASLVGREVNLDMVQECLADILRASDRKVTIDEIIRKVSDHYNLRMTDILSPRRARTVARPRQVAMFLAKTLTSKSLPEIGRRFGGRDHTTVIHAVKKIEELKSIDNQIAEDVELLRRMLEA